MLTIYLNLLQSSRFRGNLIEEEGDAAVLHFVPYFPRGAHAVSATTFYITQVESMLYHVALVFVWLESISESNEGSCYK